MCVLLDTLILWSAKIQYYFYTEIGNKKFNRKLTLSGGPRPPEGGQAGKRWWEVVRGVGAVRGARGASRTGDNGSCGNCESYRSCEVKVLGNSYLLALTFYLLALRVQGLVLGCRSLGARWDFQELLLLLLKILLIHVRRWCGGRKKGRHTSRGQLLFDHCAL